MVFGHGVFNTAVFNSDVFNSWETAAMVANIVHNYRNCDIDYWLAIEQLRDLGHSENDAIEELVDVIPDCPDEIVYGCTDPEAVNYNPDATTNDLMSPCYYNDGCTDSGANNYDHNATRDDGSCTYDSGSVLGCMDENANNYNEAATEDDDSCVYDVVGCMDETACNYDETANIDSEDCKYGDECGMFSTLESWHLIAGAILLVVLLK